MIIFIDSGSAPAPSYQDLTTYTEVDTSSRVVVTSSRSAFTTLRRNNTAYVYKDFGAAYFSGDISVDFDFLISAHEVSGFAEVLSFANQIGDGGSRTNGIIVSVFNNGGTLQVRLVEGDGGSAYVQMYNISVSTSYYCRLVRDESVGTYGTAYLYIATSSANRSSGTWATTLSIALHSSMKDYQYMYVTAGLNTANTPLISGYGENYLINAP